ncbi:VOC family protein [Mycobacteroides salmoniphilum]|uniref:VOC family protein n=1 Tax=Mycobacteroides salmoniphilum TaxID=404941 RepID=UPI00099370A3|nr:VOC family protein [Mycobacteroides salmoniphilum]QCH25221.1 Glyoxalase-like domain protein [Mycobacteroides salmoniphilum]
MTGEPTYFEIGVPDAVRAQKFYQRLFGWTPHAMGETGQAWLETGGVRGGLHNDDEDRRIDVFFGVPDIEAAVSSVRELGGEAEDPGPEEPDFGRFAFCRDDQGVRFGLHQPAHRTA